MVKIIFIEINLIKLVKIVKNKKCSEIFPESEKFNLDNFFKLSRRFYFSVANKYPWKILRENLKLCYDKCP